jgi:hypothetical protein
MRIAPFLRPEVVLVLAAVMLAACSDRVGLPSSTEDPALAASTKLPAPAGVVTVATSAGSVGLWPYTGSDFSGAPRDPVNLVITGQSDPRVIRAALLKLDGDRTALGFPAEFPFNCQWTDAVGGLQTAFDEQAGWLGSAIQLECGAYGPLRFHLRLFDASGYTIAAAHFELLIPQTTEHQVLSWTLAQQFVTADLARTGLLGAPPGAAPGLHATPTFREIPVPIYNGLPPVLRAIAGGPAGDVLAPVGIPNSGAASLLHMAGAEPILPENTRRSFSIPFNQVIPKPFCSGGPLDYVHVAGPVHFEQRVNVTPAGVYNSRVVAVGELVITAMDVTVMPPVPSAPSLQAQVREHYQSTVNRNISNASVLRQQTIFPTDGPGGGSLEETLAIGPGNSSRYVRHEICGS